LKRLWGYLDKLAQEAKANPINYSKTLQAQRPVANDPDSIDADILDANA
jgi:hypothetical protein